MNALLDAIAAKLRGDLPALKTCEVHDGRWDADELERWSVATPALLIACLGVVRTEQPGERWTDAHLQLAIYVMTEDRIEDRRRMPRGTAARNLVAWLLLHLPRTRWGMGANVGLGLPEKIRAANLYSRALDESGTAMWMVSWQQALQYEAASDGTCPPLPDELYSSAQADPPELLAPEEVA